MDPDIELGNTIQGGIEISADGRRLFINNHDKLAEYHFNVGQEFITEATYSRRSRDLNELDDLGPEMEAINFSPAGERLVMVDTSRSRVHSIYSSVVRLGEG